MRLLVSVLSLFHGAWGRSVSAAADKYLLVPLVSQGPPHATGGCYGPRRLLPDSIREVARPHHQGQQKAPGGSKGIPF